MTERCSACLRPFKRHEQGAARCKACALELVREKRKQRKLRPLMEEWKKFISPGRRKPTDAD